MARRDVEREPCALCNGDGNAAPYGNDLVVTCPECDGAGGVPIGHIYFWCD